MSGVPTFVVGAGEVGIEILCQLYEQEHTGPISSHIGYLAVDSDQETLGQTPGDIPDIYLGGDSGIVGGGVETYPYLADDISIPEQGANQMRHIGRYKLDNPVSPGFTTHYTEIRTRFENFSRRRQASLKKPTNQCNVVIINSVSGGTGSGILPLLTAVFHRIVKNDLQATKARILGIGIVPPLDINPELSAPPVEPVAYPNTYGSLHNLGTLLSATPEQPVGVPIYTLSRDLENTLDLMENSQPGTSEENSPGGRSDVSIGVESSPFDTYWLVSMAHRMDGNLDIGDKKEKVSAMVARALYAVTSHTDLDASSSFCTTTPKTSPLGTLGYATVRVPHELFEAYCKQKRKRDQLRRQRDQVVESRIEELTSSREVLVSARNESIEENPKEAANRIRQVCEHLDQQDVINADLITKNTQQKITTAVKSVEDEESLGRKLLVARSMQWVLTEGPAGSSIRSDLEQLNEEIREQYSSQLVPEQPDETAELEGQLTALYQALHGWVNSLQNQYSEASVSVRDFVPPAHEAVTSERERISRQIEQCEEDLDQVSEALGNLEALQTAVTLVEEYTQSFRAQLRNELRRIDQELDHLRNEQDAIQRKIDNIGQQIDDRRASLTDPANAGTELKLPLDRDGLDDWDLDEVKTQLTSIAKYRHHGLLAVDDEAIEKYLEQSYQYSRGWPETIGQHSRSAANPDTLDRTAVLYHQCNEPLVEGFVGSITGSDRYFTPSGDVFNHSEDPFEIEVISTSHGGDPRSLVGFTQLADMAEEGLFEAMAGSYRDFRRAVAYPEWMGPETTDAFETGDTDRGW